MKNCTAEVNNKLDRVEERLDLLTERALKTELSACQIKQNSVERLETINLRFDETNETIKANNQRDRWLVSMLFGFGVAFASVVFYLWMEPMEARIDKLEDQLYSILLDKSDRV